MARSKSKRLIVLIIAFLLLFQIQTNQSFGAVVLAPQDFFVTVNQYYNQLNWANPNSNFSYILLERSVDGGNFIPFSYITSDKNTYRDYSISNGRVYQYRAKAVDGAGSSSFTPVVEAINLYPFAMEISNAYENQVDIKWKMPAISLDRNPDYQTVIERKKSKETLWYVIATIPTSETSYRDTTAQENTDYQYRIRMAYSEKISSDFIPSSEGMHVRTPISLTTPIWGYALPNGQISLLWDMSRAGDHRVTLERKDASGTYTAFHYSDKDNHIDSGLTPGSTYAYRLYMQSTNGNRSIYSDEIKITAETIPSPTDFVVEPVASDQVNLSWSYPYEEETGFEVWRHCDDEKDSSGWVKIANVPRNSHKFFDKTTTYGKEYTYRIRAYRGESTFSMFSKSVSIINKFPELPKPPVFYVSRGILYIYSQDPVPKNTTYTLEFREKPYEAWESAATQTDGTLKAVNIYNHDSEFYYRIRASIDGLDSYSPEIYFFGVAPEPPSELNASHIGSDRVIIKWVDNSNKERGFNIYRTVNGIRRFLGKADKDATTFTDTNPQPGQKAYYEVVATNTVGDSATIYLTVGVPEKVVFSDIGAYKWAHEAISTLEGLGALDNIEKGQLFPQNVVSRGRLAFMIINSFSIDYDLTTLFPVADVNPNHIYYKEIATAVNLGLMHPDIEGKVHPQRAATRQDVILILNRVLALKEKRLFDYDIEILEQFSDYDEIAPEDLQMMASFVGEKIITGKVIEGEQRLDQTAYAAKVEIVAFIHRILKRI